MALNLNSLLQISASAMSAQSERLNLVASNMANANSESSSAETAYKARKAVFAATMQEVGHVITPSQQEPVGVQVLGIVESDAPSIGVYKPGHPLADKDGMVYGSNVNVMEEMTDMIAASRAYQDNAMVAATGQQLLFKTLELLGR